MPSALLRTKLFAPPIRPNRVTRPHLIQRLNHVLEPEQRLAFVSAPAGFGKTTLLGEWTQQCGLPVAWLSLDADDNDLMRFLAYVIAALQTIAPQIGRGAQAALQSAEAVDGIAILTSLLNDVVDREVDLVLVLDDYHLIDSAGIDEMIGFILEHQPPNLHLAMATRHDPNLPLARLRVRGQLDELRAADLRFSEAEAADFLSRVMGLDLSADRIAALGSRTEGWIAGLQMAAISLQSSDDADGFITSFTGSNRFVLDYLVEEVLEQQAPEIQAFLLQTSILNRLSGPLCDAVRLESEYTEDASSIDGWQILEQLDRANLFVVPLDEERRWYRYHHLFADLLRRKLRQLHSERLSVLHSRASEWYDANGHINDAIEHALRANAPERAADLLAEAADLLWQKGAHGQLRRWLNALPSEMISDRPRIGLFHAWYLFASGNQDSAESVLQAVESALDGAVDQPARQSQQRVRGRVATVRAFMASFRGEVPAMILHARQALEALPEDDLTWRSSAAIVLGDAHGFAGDMPASYEARLAAVRACEAANDTYFILIANLKLAITLRSQGRLQETIDVCRQQLQFAQDRGLGRSSAAGWCLAIWAEVLAQRNELDRALEMIRQAVDLTERGLDLAMIGWSRLCQVRVLFSAERFVEVEKIIQTTAEQAREADVPPWILSEMESWQIRLWLTQGNLDYVRTWASERGLIPVDLDQPLSTDFFLLREHHTLARILVAQGKLGEALALLERLLDSAETSGRISSAIEIAIQQALAHQIAGAIDQALTALAQALALAEPGGMIRIFVDEGAPMARLLRTAVAHDIAAKHASQLLAAFPDAPPKQYQSLRTATPIPDPQSALVEPLSDRELEVLRLIADGLTNRQIGERLYLSLNTIKVHTRNIYGKLGVHSRTQAVATANEMGLFPDG